MAILNQVFQRVDWIQRELSTQSLDVPDRLGKILQSRARYKANVASSGYSLSYLSNTPRAQFYRGLDEVRAQEFDPQLKTVIATWTNLMAPIQFIGTELEETLGISTHKLLRDNYGLEDMNKDERLIVTNHMMAAVEAMGYGVEQARVDALWGNYNKLDKLSDNDSRLPINVHQVFDTSSGLYGESADALGTFEAGHPFARTGNGQFGSTDQNKMTPAHWDFRSPNGRNGTGDAIKLAVDGNGKSWQVSTNDSATRRQKIEKLIEILSYYVQIVPGPKLAVCDNPTFSSLASFYLEADKFPLTIGNDRWEHQIRCVVIEGVYFISDVNKPTAAVDNFPNANESIYIFDIGSAGSDNGSFFPYYWTGPDSSAATALQMAAAGASFSPSYGMDLGGVRPVPFYFDEFNRFTQNADAVFSNGRLKYMTVCPEPWKQLVITGITA